MASPLLCDNCAVAHSEEDLFCENCGYDFVTGSLPESEVDPVPVPHEIDTSVQHGVTQLTVEIEVSVEQFEVAVEGSELELPDPIPKPVSMTIDAVEVHIGRKSNSRGIHPDIDLAELTSDPAVSSRHAVLRVGPHGSIFVTDLGSTNGTVIGEPSGEPVAPNEAVELPPEAWMYLGAWSRLRASTA